MNASNSTGVVQSCSRDSIASVMSKMAMLARCADELRISRATFDCFCRDYVCGVRAEKSLRPTDRLFGLRIVFDETLRFGEYKLEPKERIDR